MAGSSWSRQAGITSSSAALSGSTPRRARLSARRVARAKASNKTFGVFLGKRQVGMRVEADGASQDKRVRFFSMKNTPANWSDDLVKEIIADQTALQQVSVHRKLTRNGRATWFLKARSPVEDGCHMLRVAEGDENHTYWMLPVRGEQMRASKPIREKGAFVFERSVGKACCWCNYGGWRGTSDKEARRYAQAATGARWHGCGHCRWTCIAACQSQG